VKLGARREDWFESGGGTAVGIESELVVAGTVEEALVATTACEGITTGSAAATGPFGPASAGSDGSMIASASGVVVDDGIGIALIVPIAEETAAWVVVGAAAGCSACVVEEEAAAGGGGGGASTELVCICGACSTAGEVVTSVGATTAGSGVVKMEVAAVRARERVHRLPFTVVIDSCGDAMQATGS
tara:strand:+ start:2657 stop:3217 length:561 start_codon:yes stop_codon:yes gene_type:complete